MPRPLLALALILLGGAAAAHVGDAPVGGLRGGFLHPLLAWDHLIVVIAAGLWSALIGGRALWALPAVFVLSMTGGMALAQAGVPVPQLATGLAMSGVLMGLLVLIAVEPPLAVSVVIVAIVALYHGQGHGGLLAAAAERGTAYLAGFAGAHALLLAGGIGLGLLSNIPSGAFLVRAGGALVAAAGVYALSLAVA